METKAVTEFPMKMREMQNNHFDSTKWNGFKFRDDDIVVTTAYKSGTTWIQNILCQLVYQGKDIPMNTIDICPWFDFRMPPIEIQDPVLEAIADRRQLKTHLRLDAVVFSPKAKYIYVGRDARDCYMSLINHYRSFNEHCYSVVNLSPGNIIQLPVLIVS
jgi:aryl sulfotransferase